VPGRVRLGFGRGILEGPWDFMLEGNLVTSYRLGRVFEPYAAIGYATHFIDTGDEPPRLEDNQSLREREGTGEGVLEALLGVAFRMGPGSTMYVEYQVWLPGHEDLGNGFAFVPNHIFALSFGFLL